MKETVLKGTLGGHQVEVEWDAERQSFSCHFFLSTGRKVHCSIQTDPAGQPQEGKHKRWSYSSLPLKPSSLENNAAVRKLDESASGDVPEHEPKRLRIAADEVENEEVTNINDVVHHEMISLVLQETTRHFVVMWVVCWRVCRLWKDLLPPSDSFKKRAAKEWKNVPKFCVEATSRGWLSLLSWGLSKSGKERNLLEVICWAAVKKGRMEVLTWIATNYKGVGNFSSDFHRRPWQEQPNEATFHC